MSGAMPQPAARLEGLEPYAPPGRGSGDELLLDANEGPPVDERALSILRTVRADDLRRYPDAGTLETRLADDLGVSPQRVIVTAGADDAIDRLCRAVLEPGRRLLVHAPTFEMIERSGRLAGAAIDRCPWMGGPFPVGAMIERITPATSLAAIVSPNNPTGGLVQIDEIEEVASALRRVGGLLMVDQAYIEFADKDPTTTLIDIGNVVITRTFSKAFGLAALRVGYAIAPPVVARWLRTVGGPYPVAGPSLAVAGASLAVPRAATIDRVRHERSTLTAELRSRGWDVLESSANFVLTRLPSDALEALRRSGVRVRTFSGRPDLDGWTRITLPGDEAAFDRLRLALETTHA